MLKTIIHTLSILFIGITYCNPTVCELSIQTKQDLAFIYKTLVENHPGYHNTWDPVFKQILEKSYNAALEASNTVSSLEEYAHILQTFAHSFDDEHLAIRMLPIIPHPRTVAAFTAEEITPDIIWVTLPTFNLQAIQQPQLKQQQLNSIIEHMPAWREKKVIVFDVRGNDGGSSYWAERIVKSLFSYDYATTKMNKQKRDTYIEWCASHDNLNHLKTYLTTFQEQWGLESDEYKEMSVLCRGMQTALQENKMYFLEKPDTSYSTDASNPVKAKIIVIIDKQCKSACLSFIDHLKAVTNVTLMGETTRYDRLYMDARIVVLPSGHAQLRFPMKVYRNRFRDDKQPYHPDVSLSLDQLSNVDTLKEFVLLTIC